jgi:predicted outer membrane protein
VHVCGDRGRIGVERTVQCREPNKEIIMSWKRLAAMCIPVFVAATAFADPPPPERAAGSEESAKLGAALSVLHAVAQWSTTVSQMADKRAKSDLVKDYARQMATANATADAKLSAIAKEAGVEIRPLDPQTEKGKSVLDRIKAETALLGSLDGDAFDKEYMTLVTNTQQSLIHLLDASKASAKDPKVKQFLDATGTAVQNRLKNAQDIMSKIYGDEV